MTNKRAQGWAEKKLVSKQTGYHWNARLRKSNVMLADIAINLLMAEHARSVRVVRQAKKLSFHGLRDTDTNEWLDGYDAACCDILAALQRGRTGRGK